MGFVEFLGFVISLAALIFLNVKRYMENRKRRQNPEEYARKEKQREENLRQFMRERGIDFNNEPSKIQPPPKPKKPKPALLPIQQEIQAKLREAQGEAHREAQRQQVMTTKKSPAFQQGDFGRETASAKRENLASSDAAFALKHDLKPADSYEVIRDDRAVRAELLIKSLKTPRDMLVIKEIFDKPLAMRDPFQ